MASLKDYRNQQLEKLQKLKELGFEPYPHSAENNDQVTILTIRETAQSQVGQTVCLVGRFLESRQHGQIVFIDLGDGQAQIQLIARGESLASKPKEGSLGFENIDLLTRGDFIEASGQIRFSKSGELSLDVSRLRLLSKVLRPLPYQLTETEVCRRQRYLEMAVNPKVQQRFIRRSIFWQATRNFLNKKGFIEVNNPVLEKTSGGAEAQPFETKMAALDNELFYLRISHELPLKKLLGAGFSKVYDLGPRFRNENFSDEHLPEHIATEWYWAYRDWQAGMSFCEEMLLEVIQTTFGRLKFDYQDQVVDFSQRPWPRLDYCQALAEHYDGLDVLKADWPKIESQLKKHQLVIDQEGDCDKGIDKLLKNIRKKWSGPFWLVNPPKFMCPLAKDDPQKPGTAERFWGIIAGSELLNGFSEINDPQEQLKRFNQQQEKRQAGDSEAHMLDLDFIEMLEYGMPPAVGFGYSERLFWLLEGVVARDGVPFLPMKNEFNSATKSVYPDLFKKGGLLEQPAKEKQSKLK